MTVWTDKGRCSTCKFCGMEPDGDPFCMHPVVVNAGNPIGLGINLAIRDHCGEDLKLREPHPLRTQGKGYT